MRRWRLGYLGLLTLLGGCGVDSASMPAAPPVLDSTRDRVGDGAQDDGGVSSGGGQTGGGGRFARTTSAASWTRVSDGLNLFGNNERFESKTEDYDPLLSRGFGITAAGHLVLSASKGLVEFPHFDVDGSPNVIGHAAEYVYCDGEGGVYFRVPANSEEDPYPGSIRNLEPRDDAVGPVEDKIVVGLLDTMAPTAAAVVAPNHALIAVTQRGSSNAIEKQVLFSVKDGDYEPLWEIPDVCTFRDVGMQPESGVIIALMKCGGDEMPGTLVIGHIDDPATLEVTAMDDVRPEFRCTAPAPFGGFFVGGTKGPLDSRESMLLHVSEEGALHEFDIRGSEAVLVRCNMERYFNRVFMRTEDTRALKDSLYEITARL